MSFIKNIEKFVPDLKDRAILDLGCGRGDALIEFARNGYRAIGIDVNDEYLVIAKTKAKKAGVDLKLSRGVAENLTFENESFDFINCSEVTEHVEDPQKLLAECYRVLRPNGKMYVGFHNRYGVYDHHYHLWLINWMPRALAEKVIALIGKTKSGDKKAGRQKLSEMHYFTYGEVLKLLGEYNFEYIDLRKEHINNPKLSERKILKIIAGLNMSSIFYFLVKKFIGTFHFVVIKP